MENSNVTFKVVRPISMDNTNFKVVYERQISDFDVTQIPCVLSVLRLLYPDSTLQIMTII